MVVTKATSIGVKRQPTDPRDQISFADELAALPFLAKTQILKRDKNRNREAVVNAGAFNIFRSNARLGKGLCAGDDRARRRHIRIAATNMLHELSSPSDLDLRASKRPGDLRAYNNEGSSTVSYDAAVQPVQRIGHHWGIDNFLHRHDVS